VAFGEITYDDFVAQDEQVIGGAPPIVARHNTATALEYAGAALTGAGASRCYSTADIGRRFSTGPQLHPLSTPPAPPSAGQDKPFKVQVQVALDTFLLDKALKLLTYMSSRNSLPDIVEIGTPFMMREGMDAVKVSRACRFAKHSRSYPTNLIPAFFVPPGDQEACRA
jgi:hypothetical protein